MQEWMAVVLVAASIGILFLVLIVWIRRCFYSEKPKGLVVTSKDRAAESLPNGLAKRHNSPHPRDLVNHTHKDSANYYVFPHGFSSRPLFCWADHPSLVTDAVENGWSRFGFTSYMPSSSPSVRSGRSWLGASGTSNRGKEMGVEIIWEVCQGSADFMQTIRVSPGLKKINKINSSMGAMSIKASLPLPGPPLENSSFPQEAYFEITIMSSDEDDQRNSLGKVKRGTEKTKLIQGNSHGQAYSESSIYSVDSTHSNGKNKKVEGQKISGKENRGSEGIILSLGLTGEGSLPSKLPGSYPGSIGFNSDGSVYLDGTKLVSESRRQEWRRTKQVIGCGYNPSQRKVLFTLDSELVHEIHCKSEEFGTPLYPIFASNAEISLLVNFGQCPFKYAPANAQRTPNPCFIGPLLYSPALSYEDSKELFSMGRIDSQWLNTPRNTHNCSSRINKAVDFDGESEGDLFEIVLDVRGRSPNIVLQ